jgi:hypothetical protein
MLKKITAAVVSIVFTTVVVVGTAQAQNWWKYTVAGALIGGAVKKSWKGAARGAAIGAAVGIIMDSYSYGSSYGSYGYGSYPYSSYGYGYSSPRVYEKRERRCESGVCQGYSYSISPYGRSYEHYYNNNGNNYYYYEREQW